MNSRTIRDFNVPTNIWPSVERWAQTEGYRLLDNDGTKRRYQKGHGLLILPTMLEISQTEDGVHLEAWIHVQLLSRILSLFMLPDEITIEPGGMKAVIPRSISRDAVNRLMIQLGQPLIS
jgi:hypothetical protein